MVELFVCERCARALPGSMFGIATDNMERIHVRSPVCLDCRSFEIRYYDLIFDAERTINRIQAKYDFPAMAVHAAKASIRDILKGFHEFPDEFATELLAKYLLAQVDDASEVEVVLRRLLAG